MRILVSGSSGFIGSALVPYLTGHGHAVSRLVRKKERDNDIVWDPDRDLLDSRSLDGFDAVIHLGGVNIAARRWTTSFKRAIWDSRIRSTELLVNRVLAVPRRPQVFICMSAVGYYGDRGNEVLTESSSPGNDFMAQLCVAWEKATQPLAARGVRVVNLRTGLVLSAKGGALKKMLLPFKLGLGGRLGSGNQYWSWIALDDFVAGVQFILGNSSVAGPVNMVAPNPVTNREFARILGEALHRPAVFPLPAPVIRIVFGEMGDSLFLTGQRVTPKTLERSGFQHLYPTLDAAFGRV
ncbi:MAG: TIGR01777 family protein [candidate division Zixibacteria bacterium]|nr:TIGR01777 family protein [candidate division Zixibacteria bacterium]